MVLIVRSSTDDNLIARANCGTAQVPTTIEGASVGFSIAFLLRYGWTYSKKVAYYAQHLICTDSIYSVPSEESRAVASLSLNTEHSFVSSEESRNAHFAALEASSSESRNEPYDEFGRQFEVIHGGSAFLRAVEDIWGMGEQILSSLSVRILDVDQSDMDATDIFFTFRRNARGCKVRSRRHHDHRSIWGTKRRRGHARVQPYMGEQPFR